LLDAPVRHEGKAVTDGLQQPSARESLVDMALHRAQAASMTTSEFCHRNARC